MLINVKVKFQWTLIYFSVFSFAIQKLLVLLFSFFPVQFNCIHFDIKLVTVHGKLHLLGKKYIIAYSCLLRGTCIEKCKDVVLNTQNLHLVLLLIN